MLGWFKKKFGKKTEDLVAIEPEVSEAVVATAIVAPPLPGELPFEPVAEPSSPDTTGPVPVVEEVASSVVISSVLVPDELVEELVTTVAGPEVEAPVALPVALAEIVVEVPPPTAAESEPGTPVEPLSEDSIVPEQDTTGNEESGVVVIAGDDEYATVQPEIGDATAPVAALSAFASTQEKPAAKSLFRRLQDRLGKTKESLVYRLDRLFLGKKEIDQDLFEQLEEILITADLGVSTTLELLDIARKKVKRDHLSDPQALKNIIRDQIQAYIEATDQPAELVMPAEGPFVIMVVGVNGVGKTTTIGKIAAKFVRAGQSVLLVAGDTFRAAAINQLRIWGERVGVEVIAQHPGTDPSSVVFDGLEYGVAHHFDVILIDTAGRLHTSVNLMAELKKIKRVIGKKLPGAPHEVMLVLDATTGQNGISQAKYFHEAVGVSGLTLTKLDGTAKGGIVANICREIRIPVRFIGIGEQLDDLRDFDAREFVDALFAQPAE